MKCPVCDKDTIIRREPFQIDDRYLGDFEADVCLKCNEVFFTEESAKLIELVSKEIGIWASEVPLYECDKTSMNLGHDAIIEFWLMFHDPYENQKYIIIPDR